jgi:hypothetical protein
VIGAGKYGINTDTHYGRRNCEIKRDAFRELRLTSGAEMMMLQYCQTLINVSKDTLGHVSRFTMYTVVDLLSQFQNFDIPGACPKEEIELGICDLMAYMDYDVVLKTKQLINWQKHYLLSCKDAEPEAENTLNALDKTILLKMVGEYDGMIDITGSVHILGQKRFQLYLVSNYAAYPCEINMDANKNTYFLGQLVHSDAIFHVSCPAENNAAFQFFYVHSDSQITAGRCLYAIAQEQNFAESWFKLGDQYLLSSNLPGKSSQKSGAILVQKYDSTGIQRLIGGTIRKALSQPKYRQDVQVLQNYINLYPLMRDKKIWLFVDSGVQPEERMEFIYAMMPWGKDAIETHYISRDMSRQPCLPHIILYGSDEHKLLSLFAQRIFSISALPENLFPFDAVGYPELNNLYRGLAHARLTDMHEIQTLLPLNQRLAESIERYFPPRIHAAKEHISLDEVYMRALAISRSNGGRYYQKYPGRVGLIADPFFFDTFKDAADVIYISSDNWKEELPGLSFMLITTSWTGLHDDWVGLSHEDSDIRRILYEIIDFCHQNDIQTVFYSKEDPTNYDIYINLARRCDYILTTALEVVEKYKLDCGHNKVSCLRFSCNPLFHNPVGMTRDKLDGDIIFSGSWMSRYPDRCNDMAMVFDGVLESGHDLRIVDRNSNKRSTLSYLFPPKYSPYVTPAVSHEALMRQHKLYNWSLNINSIRDSYSMFANRTYELEAMGNLLISNYNPGIHTCLPLIYTVHQPFETASILNCMTPDEIYERQIVGIRHAMTGNTCFDRFEDILNLLSMASGQPCRRVAVVMPEITRELKDAFAIQTYEKKELLIAAELEERYREFELIAFFSSDMTYNAFYLEDMVNAFKYTNCDYVTKDAYRSGGVLCEGVEHDYVSVVGSKYRTLFWADTFSAATLLEMGERVDCPNGYSVDHFNYDAKKILDGNCFNVDHLYKLSVIIPVCNNGLFLYGKAFSSLRRSSMFQDMEIILVDDGSTDCATVHYIRAIVQRYTNVKTFYFEDGGSGSLARPRNKGIEMASADYTIFLDPASEIVNNGCYALYQYATAEDCDLVLGDRIVAGRKTARSCRYDDIMREIGSNVIAGDKKDVLKQLSFFASMDPQGMMIRKELTADNVLNPLEHIEGRELRLMDDLVSRARRIAVLDLPIYVDYSADEIPTGSPGKPAVVDYLRENGVEK